MTITHPTDYSTSFRITISDLLTSDEGTYMIRANNSVGHSNTHQVMLTVKGDSSYTHYLTACNTFIGNMSHT